MSPNLGYMGKVRGTNDDPVPDIRLLEICYRLEAGRKKAIFGDVLQPAVSPPGTGGKRRLRAQHGQAAFG